MPSTNALLIEMKNIGLYFGTFHALKNISVTFNSGELIGPDAK